MIPVRCSNSHQTLIDLCKKWHSCNKVQYLRWRTWVDIDLKWRHSSVACFLRYQSAHSLVFFRKSHPSGNFRTLTAYNMKTKTNFQKLLSKPFSTCLNLSNKLNLSKRCSWPLSKRHHTHKPSSVQTYIDIFFCSSLTRLSDSIKINNIEDW